MSEAWVVDASPLILFARIGRLDLIERLAPTILIPNAVTQEVRAGQQKDRTAATALGWAEQYRVNDMKLMASIEHWDLGPGESQVISPTASAVRDGRCSMTVRLGAVPAPTICRSSDRSASSCVRRRIGKLIEPVRW